MKILSTRLPDDVVAGLRQLDPLTPAELDRTRSTTDRLDDWRDAHQDPSIPVLGLIEPPRPHPARPRKYAIVAMAVTLVVAVVVSGVWALSDRTRGSRADLPVTGAAYVRDIPPSYRAVAAKYNPLAADLVVSCEGIQVPVPMLAAPGGAENDSGPASDALRSFLANNPFQGMGTVTNHDWLLLSQTNTRLVFGQRKGPIGVGAVVTFTRAGSRFEASGLSGCGPAIPSATTQAEPVYGGTLVGTKLTVVWESGACGTPLKPERVLDRVVTSRVAGVLHIMVISRAAPVAESSRSTSGCTMGVGVGLTATVEVPAGTSVTSIRSDASIPANAVKITPKI